MTASEIRSDLALIQAQLAILSDNARALEVIAAVGAIDLAGDQLRQAYKALGGALLGADPANENWFGDTVDAPTL